MIRALLQRILGRWHERRSHAAGGHTGAPSKYQPAGYLHHGEYLYRASDGTFWHVEQHPDGDIRTQIDIEEEA